jgi:hypothetical protein
MDWVYGSRDHGSLSVHDGLTTMEWCDRSEARNVLVIAQSKRERGGCQGSRQWCHLEAELCRWPYDGAQQWQLVVLPWGDGSGHVDERLESGLVRSIIGMLSSRLL